jgi:hypothetical protein
VRRQLDRELAAGRAPGADPRLRQRADELAGAGHRLILAKVFAHLGECDDDPGIRPARINWDGVCACRPQLRHLGLRLSGDSRLRPQGLALAELLLANGSGPLYEPAATDELASAVRRVLASL